MSKAEEHKHCTMCGKEFDCYDNQENFGMNYYCGYGSGYDEHHIQMDLCCSCFEKIMDKVIPMCKESPFKDPDYDYINPNLSDDDKNRLYRIFSIIGSNKLHRIYKGLSFSSNTPAYMDLIEKELREEGYDLDKTPVERGSYIQGIIDRIERKRKKHKAKNQKSTERTEGGQQ